METPSPNPPGLDGDRPAPRADATRTDAIHAILHLARWAPSGDNTQPWRFQIAGDRLLIHGRDTRDDCVYDLRGHASVIALGALQETIAIAASTHGLRTTFSSDTLPAGGDISEALGAPSRKGGAGTVTPRVAFSGDENHRVLAPSDQTTCGAVAPAPPFRDGAPQPPFQPAGRYLLTAAFTHDPVLTPDPLAAFIEKRVTQRRPLTAKPLSAQQEKALAAALPPGYRVEFKHTFGDRFRLAKLLFKSAHIRLTTREAYATHRKVIQWNARFSEDRIPDQAVGVDPMTRRLMRWIMGSWSRVVFFNRFMWGTLAPRIQLDFMPALRCAGHFFLIADQPPATTDDFLAAGRALQRYWLTATSLGLLAQPEMTPLIFAQYTKAGVRFTDNPRALARAARVTQQLDLMLGRDVCERTVFMGRIGFGKQPVSRSLRLPMERLMA